MEMDGEQPPGCYEVRVSVTQLMSTSHSSTDIPSAMHDLQRLSICIPSPLNISRAQGQLVLCILSRPDWCYTTLGRESITLSR